MSRDKVTLIGEEIKPLAIAIIELRLSEGISQSVSRSVGRLVGRSVGRSASQSVENSVK